MKLWKCRCGWQGHVPLIVAGMLHIIVMSFPAIRRYCPECGRELKDVKP